MCSFSSRLQSPDRDERDDMLIMLTETDDGYEHSLNIFIVFYPVCGSDPIDSSSLYST